MTVTLKPITVKVLKHLKKKDGIDATDLANDLKQDYIVIMSCINELSDEELGYFEESEVAELTLTDEGKKYAKEKLPEIRLFDYMLDQDIKEIDLNDLQEQCKQDLQLQKKFFFISLNYLKRSRAVAQSKYGDQTKILRLTEELGDKPEQDLLEQISSKKKTFNSDLPDDSQKIVKTLKKRKLLEETKYTQRLLYLTDVGKKIPIKDIKSVEEVTRLDSDMIKGGSWKNVKIKHYDVTKPGPKIFPGKIHPLTEMVNRIREIFYSMGFMEIRGPIVESAFYNFDALFQPQDHPAREMHDTFYLSNPSKAKLPSKKQVDNVAATHENGGTTGSTGWGYKWDKKVAQQTLLRTHTTATTVRQLGKAIKEGVEFPLKVFSIDRVYRNEKVDFSHLAEFTQVEGIIIGDNLTLADLRGTLVEFYTKLGFEKVITRPGFFPYTEPSMEISVFSKELDTWMEIGGSGIFRPEVCAPWGIEEPTRVLAWGQGLERIAMLRLKRKDIRDLYKNPLSWLRTAAYPRKNQTRSE